MLIYFCYILACNAWIKTRERYATRQGCSAGTCQVNNLLLKHMLYIHSTRGGTYFILRCCNVY